MAEFHLRPRRLAAALLCALLPAVLPLVPAPALAHGIDVFAHVHDTTIHGEAEYHGGGPVSGATVTVFDPAGEKLGQTTTNEKGEFTYEASYRCDHRLVLDTGDGHGAEQTIAATQLPSSLPPRDGVAAVAEPHTHDHDTASHDHDTGQPTADQDELDTIHGELVALRRELTQLQQRTQLRDILGGIGYIVGIAGVAFYFLGVRRQQARPRVG